MHMSRELIQLHSTRFSIGGCTEIYRMIIMQSTGLLDSQIVLVANFNITIGSLWILLF